jgi:hypothetical protein
MKINFNFFKKFIHFTYFLIILGTVMTNSVENSNSSEEQFQAVKIRTGRDNTAEVKYVSN